MELGDTTGGLMGGSSGDHGYGIGDAYEGKFSGSVIVDGKLYYNKMGSPFYSTVPTQEVVCVDLHTGKVVWDRNLNNGGNLRVSFAQNLYWNCLNYRGGFSYIFCTTGTTLMAFEAETGNWVFNFTNVPSGTNYWGPNGEFLKYSIVNNGNATNPNYRLLRWNSSYVAMQGRTGMAESWGSAVQGTTWDASKGYDLNVSVPANTASMGSILYAFPGDRVIGGNVSTAGVTLWGLSLQAGHEGAVLFSNTWTAPAEWKDLTVANSIGQAGWTAWSQEDMVATYWTKENRQSYAFDLTTGKYLWVTAPQDYKDAWSDTITAGFGPDKVIAYHKYYSASVAGVVYCYDITNGNLLWTFNATDKYTESYIGNTWWQAPLFVSDGMIYTGTLEHSPLNPIPRGAPFFCLNATDGSLIFEADGLFRQTRWGGRAIIGDSVIATQDTYDQQVYGVGKGPSQTTISAPNTAVTSNTPLVIQGKVTDISPGTSDDSLKLRFPNGVPAVSDASQSEWMLYVYKQFSMPTSATGVPVSIDAMDPNGNYVHLGDATSDTSGSYSLVCTPSAPGTYVVYATFGGSGAYYSSFAQTTMVVQAASATPAPSTTAQSTIEQYFVPAIAGIIVAIAIVGILLAILLLRKHP
jgi:outer membrane protein assembly factor BamB